jgi:hypothetical protein
MRWEEQAARIGEMREMVGKPEGKRPLGRRWHRWEDIRIDHMETGWEDVEWIHLAHEKDRWRIVVNTVMNLLVP